MLIPAYYALKAMNADRQAEQTADQLKEVASTPKDPRHEHAVRVLAEYRKTHPPERAEALKEARRQQDFGR